MNLFKSSVVLSSVLGCASLANAAAVSYTIDTASSQLTITSATAFANPFSFQGEAVDADGFTAALSGNVDADVNGSSISLLNTSLVNALDTGSYLPGAPDALSTPLPASFAMAFDTPFGDVVGVTRNLTFALSSTGGLTVTPGTPSTFDVAGVQVAPVSGVADITFIPPPRRDLTTLPAASNTPAGLATIAQTGDTETLIIPLGLTLVMTSDTGSITLNLAGSITATRTIPTPGALALLGMGGLCVARRRR